jgi:hypothetical protein
MRNMLQYVGFAEDFSEVSGLSGTVGTGKAAKRP